MSPFFFSIALSHRNDVDEIQSKYLHNIESVLGRVVIGKYCFIHKISSAPCEIAKKKHTNSHMKCDNIPLNTNDKNHKKIYITTK